MAINENFPTFSVDEGRKPKRSRFVRHPLHEAALRLADIGLGRSRASTAKTRDLVALLLCHGARAWRYSQPEARIHLHVTSPSGKAPLLMRLR